MFAAGRLHGTASITGMLRDPRLFSASFLNRAALSILHPRDGEVDTSADFVRRFVDRVLGRGAWVDIERCFGRHDQRQNGVNATDVPAIRTVTTKMIRTIVGSMSKYSASPPQTPRNILWSLLRYSRFEPGGGGGAASLDCSDGLPFGLDGRRLMSFNGCPFRWIPLLPGR